MCQNYQISASHTNNYINSLLIDQSNSIWLGTNCGLFTFNEHTWQVESAGLADKELPGRNLNISDIKQSNAGDLWMIEGASLARYNTVSKELKYVKSASARLNIYTFCFDNQDNIYAANNSGEIYWINSKTFEIKKLTVDLSTIKIHGIFLIDNTLWITSDGYGISRYTTEGKLIDNYFTKKTNLSEKYSNRIRGVLQTSDKRIWIASYKGLMEWKEGSFIQYFSDYDNPFSLPDNSVVSLFEDNQKGLWIGTWRGGLAYLNPYSNMFEIYQHSPFENSVCGNIINSISEDRNQNLWIGTDGSGLDKFDEQRKIFTHINLLNSQKKSANNIKCICPDLNGNLWVGTFNEGIFLLKKGETNFTPAVFSNKNVYDILSDENGLWIATFNDGLYYYNFSDQSLKQYTSKNSDSSSLPSNYVRKLCLDSFKNLWIITNSGVCVKRNDKETFEQILIDNENSSGSVQVYTITADVSGSVWLGTDRGFILLDQSRKITNYPLLFNGKPVSVYGIVISSSEKFWISSNYGIFSYNPKNASSLNYSISDGLPGNLFNAGAQCLTSSGRVYFGGTTGLVAFNPNRMQVNPFVPKVYFSRMFINHKEILPRQENSPLQNSLYSTDILKLQPGQNSFSIEFVALNFLNPQKNQFRYRLKGFDPNWVEAGYLSKATYTNIEAGKYVFEVMACNNDMVWNNQPASLTILIPRPILLSNTALVIYLIFLVFGIILARRIILHRTRLEHEIELERVHRIQEENAHQNKMVFFTNISHELRTPLTLIAGPVDTLLKSPNLDQGQFNQLSLIKRNAGRLLKLINQLLEFRKIENEKMELNVCKTDLVEFVHDIYNYFIDIAQQKNINYDFVSLCDHLPATFDTDKIDKAVFNLLSNAFKFTPEKGNIRVELTTGQKKENPTLVPEISVIGKLASKEYVQISVEDNGPGLEKWHLEKIFDRFYKVENSEIPHSGTGIGLHLTKHLILLHGGEIEVESSAGKGSIFRIRIPLVNQGYQAFQSLTEVVVNPVKHPYHPDNFAFSSSEENESYAENWSDTGKNRHGKLILIVEDHQDLRNFISHILSDDYRIILAGNGKDGMEKAQIFLPDLIISDIMMPDKNGIDMVKELKTNLNTSHIPVILLTALISNEYKIEGFNLGVDDFIEKPFSSTVLKARIKNIFANRESLQKSYSQKIAVGFENDTPDNPDQKMLVKAIRFVEKNITDELLNIDMLANHLNLSQSTLYRKLKALTDKSATDFIRTIRLEFAAKLLKDGHDNIEEVSGKAGFNSHSYFTRSFKEHFGKTPSEFVAMHQQEK